jgi:hypothetical protein
VLWVRSHRTFNAIGVSTELDGGGLRTVRIDSGAGRLAFVVVTSSPDSGWVPRGWYWHHRPEWIE